MEKNSSAAAADLADIEAQQDAVSRRIGAEKWPPPALGLALGALAASLAWRNTVLFAVVMVLYLASLLWLVGTPVKFGVVPRHGRRSLAVTLVACVFAMVTPQVAVVGPWWTAIAVGVFAAVFVPLFGRWRRAQLLRDLAGPAVRKPGAAVRRVDAVTGQPAFVPVAAAVMAGAVLVMHAGWFVAVLAYLPGALLIQRRQLLVGALPAGERTGRFRAVVSAVSLVLWGTPPAISLIGPGHGGWVAPGHAGVVAATVLLAGRWQQRRLAARTPPR
jgi:hypothetical protein